MNIGGVFMDYTYLCKKIGDMSSIPIRLYINNELKLFLITHNQQVNPINEIVFTHKY